MTKTGWLELAKERIEMVMHNEENKDNVYLKDAIKFINEVIEELKIENK